MKHWLAGIALGAAMAAEAQPALFVDGFEGADPRNPRMGAAALLHRATFGPTMAEIDRVVELGPEAWIDEQQSLPISWTRRGFDVLRERNRVECLEEDPTDPECDEGFLLQEDRHSVWFQTVLTAEDQLRHRMAFALSQILVVSQRDSILADLAEPLAAYYDMLLAHSFGNFRDLLEDVTKSPVMGTYLSHVGNRKAVPELNIRPDENYAREVMQLFTIGLNQLDRDGTALRDPAGLPIPTYGQAEVKAMARVLTGWTFGDFDCDDFEFAEEGGDYILPMAPCEEYHDTDPKTIINGIELPANQTADADLDLALDALFNHPNVGPFIGRRLIQRLVTSNPSPAYIERVAAVFADNGAGVRGDLGAVAKAILLDPEAQAGTDGRVSFGKLREPLLRLTNLWRTFDGRAETGEYYLDGQPEIQGQAVLASPSVFNFFLPDYRPAGLSGAGLFAPEFQLASDDLLTANLNVIDITARFLVAGSGWIEEERESEEDFDEFFPRLVLIHPTAELALGADTDALLDRLDLLLLTGTMSPELRTALAGRLAALEEIDDPSYRLGETLSHIFMSPEYLIQR
ncbi:MAG: DUF1800 domain-containing protein [Pseudomonadota bacterium]